MPFRLKSALWLLCLFAFPALAVEPTATQALPEKLQLAASSKAKTLKIGRSTGFKLDEAKSGAILYALPDGTQRPYFIEIRANLSGSFRRGNPNLALPRIDFLNAQRQPLRSISIDQPRFDQDTDKEWEQGIRSLHQLRVQAGEVFVLVSIAPQAIGKSFGFTPVMTTDHATLASGGFDMAVRINDPRNEVQIAVGSKGRFRIGLEELE